jgi:prophage DNA circulation protein
MSEQLQATPLLSKKLLPASFRKIPFQVESTEFETGRRVQVHEYPQRDKPYPQDMGRSTRNIEFNAFVVGADYVEQTNALLGAIEEYGAGTLIHPWFGSLKVNCLPCRVSLNKDLGLATFSLSFVEAGELKFPSSATSTAAASRKAAKKLEEKSVNRFAQVFKALKFISNVAEQALTIYGKVLAFIANPVFALSSLLGFGALPGNLLSLGALFGAPISLGWTFAGLLNLSGKAKSLSGNDSTLAPAIRGLTRMAIDPALAQPATPIYTTATTAQININQIAILAHARQLLLVQAVGLSSYLNCSIYDDTLALKNELAAALDAEMLLATDDDLYQSLADARSAMWEDLTARSRDSARLSTITPPDVLPMLAIAYDYYEDANRDLEIIGRNKIHHPAFVPVKNLLVLSR